MFIDPALDLTAVFYQAKYRVVVFRLFKIAVANRPRR